MTRPALVQWSWRRPAAKTPDNAIALFRRGVHHGFVQRGRTVEAAEPRSLWDSGEALYLRRLAAPALRPHARDIAGSSRLFERLREGSDFEAELWRRLEPHTRARSAGSSVDLSDPREIEKVHVDLSGRARDLYAKLSWISPRPEDESLRIRFSFGSESLDDWQRDPSQAKAADTLAELCFPECAAVARVESLRGLLRDCCEGTTRFSERILYSNAPGGGARFHHDAEPGQLGVAYIQLRGATAWLALPKWRLAELSLPRDLDGEGKSLDRWLNSTAGLTRRLVEANAFYLLRAGDALLLPSPSEDAAAWHSVFALGDRPSLSWSFGIFRD
jgi:hypothetical protein